MSGRENILVRRQRGGGTDFGKKDGYAKGREDREKMNFSDKITESRNERVSFVRKGEEKHTL